MSTPGPSHHSGASEHDDAPDPLELTSLDSDSLFSALSAVEDALPDLLLDIKPILAHLSPPATSSAAASDPERVAHEEEQRGMAARAAVERYMTTLDKIQYILRQTTYFLRETSVLPSVLRPPHPADIPAPFSAALPGGQGAGERVGEGEGEGGRGDGDGEAGRGDEPDLGLYASRVEVGVLREMKDALKALREGADREVTGGGRIRRGREEGEGDGMDVDVG